MTSTRGQSSPLALVTLLAVAGALATAVSRSNDSPEDPWYGCSAAGSADLEECPADTTDEPEPASLAAGVACPEAGYLCAPLAGRSEVRVLRWSADRPQLRVHVPLPTHEPRERARELQRAAVRGIQAWQGKPFPLQILDREQPQGGEVDISVTWAHQLDGSALGTTRTRWEGGLSEASFTDVSFVLATRSPFSRIHPLTPGQVELVAAHEMGHALGLPHSDHDEDLMYPQNTAGRLSARDYRTMEALYRMPNGVYITSD